ncbi:MAG: hypothetical protein KDA51_09345, partial [Planctomycetales bacterium]|nr:hypothetical protein [Planctomycetales bacterium]
MHSFRLGAVAMKVRPRRCFISGLVICLLVATTGSWLCAQVVDRIFVNGKVVTVDAEFGIAQAVAVAGDRIVAVGSNEAIRRLANPATDVVDLDGAMMLPGLIDSHVHATN